MNYAIFRLAGLTAPYKNAQEPTVTTRPMKTLAPAGISLQDCEPTAILLPISFKVCL